MGKRQIKRWVYITQFSGITLPIMYETKSEAKAAGRIKGWPLKWIKRVTITVED